LLQTFSADSRRLQAGNLETLHIDLPGDMAVGVLPCLMFMVALVVIVLGIAQTLGARINPGYQILAGHLVFLAILTLRPQGFLQKFVETP
jgi:hypothetical protein